MSIGTEIIIIHLAQACMLCCFVHILYSLKVVFNPYVGVSVLLFFFFLGFTVFYNTVTDILCYQFLGS